LRSPPQCPFRFERKRLLLLLTALMAFPLSAVASETGHQRFRMDFGWRFALGDPPDAEKPNFDDKAWRQLNVPHDWSIEGPRSRDNPSGSAGGYAPIGIGWYRRTFYVPQEFGGRRVLLDFDGVFNRSDVWINGRKVGHNEYGYIGFECDLTPWIRFNRDNVIAVRVDNLRQVSRWYTGSGIYRHVWLIVTSPLHVANWGTFVSTPQITAAEAQVNIHTTLRNDSEESRNFTLVTHLTGPTGEHIASIQSVFDLPRRSELTATQFSGIPNPRLWTPETPVLYRAVTEARESGHLSDTYETPFGIRSIRFDVNNGFTLNGARVILKGVCLHDDLGALGAAALESGIERRLKILKTIGVNAIRLSHDAHSPEMLDLADRLGLLVFDEAFDKWEGFLPDGTGWKQDLRATILRDRNHPSVFIWSVGNEMTPHMYLREGTLLYQAMQDFVHQLDPTRLVTAALHPVRNNKGERDAPLAEIANYMDVISMNYQTHWYPRDHQQHPQQVLLGSETHIHQVDLNTVRDPKDNSGNQWWGTRDYDTNQYFPYVAGQFIWAGVDYLGEAGAWPSKGYRTTLVSTTGLRKPFSYFIQSLYSNEPIVWVAVANPDYKNQPKRDAAGDWLALRSDWNLPATPSTVRVYTFTNAPLVELLLNGRSLGKRRAIDYPDHIILWDVPNEPGTLRAVAEDNGRVIATHELQTAGKAARLAVLPERTAIDATGEDLAYVEVRALDAAGRIVPDARHNVHFEITGPGTLAAVDNGDLDSPEPFKATQRELRGGGAFAIIQSTRQPGTIRLTARTDNLESAIAEIQVRPPSSPIPMLP
jgi:beta-galactosidase